MDTHSGAIIHRVSRPARLAASLAATALLLAAALPATAQAGTYTVTACNAAPGGANNSWVPFNTDTTHLQTRLSCPYTINEGQLASQENGIATTDILELPNGAQAGAEAGWTFKVPHPENEKITGISYDRMFSTQDQYWIPALRADSAILPGQTCTPPIAGSCLNGSGPGGENHATLTGLSAETLTLGLQCTAPAGQECITGADDFHAAVATMYAAEVTIQDNTPPTLQLPTGPLWENTNYHKGTENLTIAARDSGGGTQTLTMSIDGQPVETYTAPCNYTYPQPCPSQITPTLTLNTTKLPDGTHTLTLVTTDAAGNQSTQITRQITIANNPPPAPTNMAATPTQAGSSVFNVTWTNPADPTPITEATYQLCPADGPCAVPIAAPATGPATVTVPEPGTWTLAVWLHDAAGNSNPADAARTTLTVLPDDYDGGTGGISNSSSRESSSNSDSNKSNSTAPKIKLHVTEALRGRKLTVRVTGSPTDRQVHVRYVGRYHGRLIAAAAKKATLRHGKLTIIFVLSKLAAARATIQVTALLGHNPAATSTLRRYKAP
jgi:hypothetical protein